MTDQVKVTRRLSQQVAKGFWHRITQVVSSVRNSFGISQYARMWLAGLDTPGGKSSKPTKPYAQVDLVFACVERLINGIAGIPLVLSTLDEKIVESGPAYDLLFSSPTLSWDRFVTETVGHYALSRDVFWIFTDMAGTRPKEIMVVSGTQMHPITHNSRSDGVLIGWEFRGPGGQRAKFSLLEVVQWKNFNPYDRFHGIGPASASNLSINYSYAASLFNTSALENGAEPGIILTTQGKLDPDEVNLLRSHFDARHRGAGNAKRTAVLTGGMDVKTMAMNMVDMDVANLTTMSDKKLCITFGVPPELVGLATEAQYSHGPAQRDFIYNTIMPLAAIFAGHITSGILSKFLTVDSRSVSVKDARLFSGMRTRHLSANKAFRDSCYKAISAKQKVFAWFDSSQHPTVQEYQREVAEKTLKFTEAGVPLNQIIEAHDLPYETVDWGDDWWIGMGQVPARLTLEAGLEGITGPSLPEGGEEGKAIETQDLKLKAQKADDQQRLRLWRNWVTSWAGFEREYTDAMRIFFVRQQRILLSKLKSAITGSKSQKADVDDVIARVVFDLKVENGKIKVINQTFFGKASELGIRQSLIELLQLHKDELDELVERIKKSTILRGKLNISTTKITNINKTTQQMIASQLRQGLESGEGLNELTARVQKTLGSNRARALSIARTQTAGAVNTGRHEGMKAAGTQLKAWITSGDPEVRDAHIEAGRRYAEGIPLEVPFQVAGEMLIYPGDPSGSAANIINCRCLEITRRAKGKQFDLNYYCNLKFYSYSDMRSKKKDKENED